jgi:hypothetical protein
MAQITKPNESVFSMVKRAQVETDAAWHLDKKVPIAMIMAIVFQTGGMVWWAASAAERLNALERKADIVAPQAERLARVETKLESVQDGILEIKSILRKEPSPLTKAR